MGANYSFRRWMGWEPTPQPPANGTVGQDVRGGGRGADRREGRVVNGREGEVERREGQREGEEGQIVREGEGEVEDQREENIGPQAAEPQMQPLQPAGHTEYSLSPELKPNPIGSEVQFPESYLELARVNFHEIDQKYNEALEKRREIDTLLQQFQRKLGLQGDADFPSCYQQLTKKVKKPEHIKLSSEEPLQITLGEEETNGNGVQEAVEMFNSMLLKCSEFPAQVKDATTYIEERMKVVESRCSVTDKTKQALQIASASLKQIHSFGEGIEKLVWDVEVARTYLRSGVTGLRIVLPPS